MQVDFAIAISSPPLQAKMTFDETTDLGNNVYLSLWTPLGSFFQDENFGSKLYQLRRSKNTAKTVALAEAWCQAALAWLITAGRATAIDVTCEIVPSDPVWQMRCDVQVIQANGQPVTFSVYTPVV
jgi:phage gp46-like protein